MGQELKPGEAELLIELAERLGVRLVPWQVQVLLQFLRSLEQQRAVGPRNRRIASLVSSQLCKLAHAAWNRLKP